MLTLRSGESSLVLAPEIGGAIVGWTLGAVPLFRRPMPDAIIHGTARGLGCFPLVPFSNRIATGRFRWSGTDYALDRNFGDHPHTIHGVGWQSAWQTASVSATSAVLTLEHDAKGSEARRWPFAFVAEQQFRLEPDRLQVSLSMRNRHQGIAPAGLGLHPYFPRTGNPILRFHAEQVWLNGSDALPSKPVPIPSAWDHSKGAPIGKAELDNCFAGWDGQAQITWPSSGVTLAIDAGRLLRHLIVYTPPRYDFFCVEPVSHMNDAINRVSTAPDHGLRTLAAGEVLSAEVNFRLMAKV